MQFYTMLLIQFDYKTVKDLATATWLVDVKLLFTWSRDWTISLTLRKSLSILHFQIIRLLNQYVFDRIRYGANWKNIFKVLGLFIEGSVQGFSFCPPKAFKPNK